MDSYVYDIECFESLFTATFISADKKYEDILLQYELADITKDVERKKYYLSLVPHHIFIITHEDNSQLPALARFINNKNLLLYGYNNLQYDDILLKAILLYGGSSKLKDTTVALREISDNIINNQSVSIYYITDPTLKTLAEYKQPFASIDLKSLNYLNNVSLKFVAILLKHYRIQDLPYHNLYISEYRKTPTKYNELIIDYNINDVLITKKLLHFSKQELRIRIVADKKYGVNSTSASRSTLANLLLQKYYAKVTGRKPNTKIQTIRNRIKFNEIIQPIISFKTDEFNDFLNTLKNINFKVGVDKFTYSILSNGVKYNLGIGGLHSQDRGINIVSTEDYDLIDVDVNSYYPSTILNYKIHPEHIPDYIFLPIINNILVDRLDAKSLAKDKSNPNHIEIAATADVLKIVVNIIYGMLGDVFRWLLDHKAMYAVTLNCQLGLLMLIEDLTLNDFQVISANTDGVVSIVPHYRYDLYIDICSKWSTKLNYGVEYTKYSKYYATNVNNYIAIKTNGEVKVKGDFTKDKSKLHDYLLKGYDKPIIAIAIYEYIVNNKPIEETIRNHKDIHDFLMAQKVGGDFKPYKKYIVDNELIYEPLQKTIRYYVSNKGVSIVKKKENKEISLLTKHRLTVFNDFEIKDDYDINYNYYISEAYKLIYGINNLIHNKNRKQNGTLFD